MARPSNSKGRAGKKSPPSAPSQRRRIRSEMAELVDENEPELFFDGLEDDTNSPIENEGRFDPPPLREYPSHGSSLS